MKQLELIQGTLYLDGEKVPCVKSFNLNSSTKGNGVAELTICMDVTMVKKEGERLKRIIKKTPPMSWISLVVAIIALIISYTN